MKSTSPCYTMVSNGRYCNIIIIIIVVVVSAIILLVLLLFGLVDVVGDADNVLLLYKIELPNFDTVPR